ncbi:MAG: DNA polymerase III subunit gamma/tau [Deltaproteobacteria bacterium]|nr:DNA polymerase III subunit gamma/tau [Deltaproteobacteria bacterium]
MSYLVFARKYRPQTFAEVVQQEHVTRTLSNAIAAGRVAHAILFTGPRGTGKTTVARILAKAMNCEKGPTKTPCNVCRSCTEITAGSGADVYEIDGASNNGVDQIRELRENIKYMPAHSRFKIYIIDEVHMLSTPAFNALLKTLEEPPAHIMFLLATTEPQKIPVTILSRCQRHDLRRMDGDAMAGHMAAICGSEAIDIEPQSLDLIAGQAGGSMRDALSLLDQVTSGVPGPITPDSVLDILGIVDRKSVAEFSNAILKGDLAAVLRIIDEVHAFGHSTPDFYSSVIQYFRDLTVISMVASPEKLIDLQDKEIHAMKARVKDVSPLFLNQILEILFNAEKGIRWSAHPKMAFEIAMIRLLQTTPLLPIGDLIDKLDELRAPLGAPTGKSLSETQRAYNPPSAAEKETDRPARHHQTSGTVSRIQVEKDPDPAPETALTGGTVREDSWQRLLEIISEQAPSIAPNLAHSRLIGFTRDKLEIEVNGSSFNFNRVNRKDSMKLLEDVCTTYFGRKVTLVIRAGKSKDNQDNKKKKSEIERLKQEVLDHPLVADAIEIFNGKIVDVKIDT